MAIRAAAAGLRGVAGWAAAAGGRSLWSSGPSAASAALPATSGFAAVLRRGKHSGGPPGQPPKLDDLPDPLPRHVTGVGYVLRGENINPHLLKAEYAVRGTIPARAAVLKRELLLNKDSLPFDQVIDCHIGNPQALGQRPITFFREVMALCDYPDLLQEPLYDMTKKMFSADSIERAALYLANVKPGAYSESQGYEIVRKEVARFIEERDGHPAYFEDIFLINGASEGILNVLSLIMNDNKAGIMIPVPQYPLYSAAITLFDGKAVPYNLNEERGWLVDPEELRRSLETARKEGTNVRGICVINPGNPTGQCLKEDDMREIINFCNDEGLVLLADEVYQENIYYPEETPFVSFKKVLREMEDISVELFNFHSVSKGFIGEGQLMTGLMVNPPRKGSPSHDRYIAERDDIIDSLKRRSIKMVNALNELPGYKCNISRGAMYAFPRVTVPERAVVEAKKARMPVDTFYCLHMVNETGVCVVPGSGFSKNPEENTFWYRTTFLPLEHTFDDFLAKIKDFHLRFCKEHAD